MALTSIYRTSMFAATIVALAGCAFLNPYSNSATYAQGEKPSIAFSSVLGQLGTECDSDAERARTDCRPIGKVILTRPDSNQSYQFFRYKDTVIDQVITCASPAEVAKALGVNASAGLSIATAASKAASGSLSSNRTETITVLGPNDAPTHFLAAASFYNCLAYASRMYDSPTKGAAEKTATEFQKMIIEKAVQLDSATKARATASSGG